MDSCSDRDVSPLASSGLPARLLLFPPCDPRMLDLRASRRLIGRAAALEIPSVGPRLLLEYLRDGDCFVEGVGEETRLGASDLPSHNASTRSVRLRHMVSAFLRTCRSETVTPLIMDAAVMAVPCGPALPVMAASWRASAAVASSVRNRVGLSSGFAFAKAAWRLG